jgi:pyruvate dehydrogenase E2 component (dihydrolipoamide acetyltransferase)
MSISEASAAFGEISERPLSRLQALTAKTMSRNWSSIPHVTHHEEADITALEAMRQSRTDLKVGLLPLLMKATAATLCEFPSFNAAFDDVRNVVIEKRYVHLGVAVDVPGGLLVPVIRDCDARPAIALAEELRSVSQKARGKGLSYAEMSGSSFTISSIGAAGGVGFTPIINAPDVAILGATAARLRPQWIDGAVAPRLILPLSLSYDHRVINGVQAALFCSALAKRFDEPAVLFG